MSILVLTGLSGLAVLEHSATCVCGFVHQYKFFLLLFLVGCISMLFQLYYPFCSFLFVVLISGRSWIIRYCRQW